MNAKMKIGLLSFSISTISTVLAVQWNVNCSDPFGLGPCLSGVSGLSSLLKNVTKHYEAHGTGGAEHHGIHQGYHDIPFPIVDISIVDVDMDDNQDADINVEHDLRRIRVLRNPLTQQCEKALFRELDRAVSNCNFEKVETLLNDAKKNKLDLNLILNESNDNGLTLLYVAAGVGFEDKSNAQECLEIIKLLVANGADVNVKNLGIAMDQRNPGVRKSSQHRTPMAGRTPLFNAADKLNFEIVKFLIEEQGADVNERDFYGESALHLVVRKGNSDGRSGRGRREAIDGRRAAVELIDTFGAVESINTKSDSRDSKGETPIHIAAMNGDVEMMNILLELAKKIDAKSKMEVINAKNNDGDTALHIAVSGRQIGYQYNNNQPFHTNKDVVDVLLRNAGKGGKKIVETKNAMGNTPLHSAVWSGNFEAMRLLLEYGADVMGRGQKGLIPLHFAAMSNYSKKDLRVVETLIDAMRVVGTKSDANGDTDGNSNNGNSDFINSDIKSVDPINTRADNGYIALHFAAAYFGDVEVIKALLRKNADPNITDNNGKKPLDLAKSEGVRTVLAEAMSRNCLMVKREGLLAPVLAEDTEMEIMKYLS